MDAKNRKTNGRKFGFRTIVKHCSIIMDMIKNFKNVFQIIVSVIFLVVFFYIILFSIRYYLNNKNVQNLDINNNINTINKNLYNNYEFGFTLNLNENWINNYSVSTSSIPFGNLVSIENTKYKKGEYMNVPILIYPKAKWNEWENNNFENYPTAAPIGPKKRGENEKYVFATAPRYNFSFLPGHEEVEIMLESLKGN